MFQVLMTMKGNSQFTSLLVQVGQSFNLMPTP